MFSNNLNELYMIFTTIRSNVFPIEHKIRLTRLSARGLLAY